MTETKGAQEIIKEFLTELSKSDDPKVKLIGEKIKELYENKRLTETNLKNLLDERINEELSHEN